MALRLVEMKTGVKFEKTVVIDCHPIGNAKVPWLPPHFCAQGGQQEIGLKLGCAPDWDPDWKEDRRSGHR